MSKGWVRLHRSIQENWMWTDAKPFSKALAWIDLILMANYEDTQMLYKDEVINCYRGTVNRSMMSLAERWGWDKRTVKRFLTVLEKEGMCTLECTTHRTVITLVKYDFYQDVGTTECTTKCTANALQGVPQTPIKKKENKDNKEINIYSRKGKLSNGYYEQCSGSKEYGADKYGETFDFS